MSVALGTRYSFTYTFVNSSGTATNPTAAKFYLREEVDGSEYEWTYNAAPVSGTHYPVGMQPMTTSGTSTYAVAYDTKKPERVTGFFVGTGAVYDSRQLTLFVRHAGIATLDPPSS